MALTDYSIDTSGSPQDVQRKQALADALMKQGMDSSAAAGGKGGGWVTALNRGLAGALGGYQQGQAQQEQTQGRESVRQQLAAALGADGKVNPQAYLQAASNPFATPGQIGAVGKVQDWQHQTEQDAEHKREFGVTSGFQANADRRAAAEEARKASNFQSTPDQYVPNPRANEPGQPAYIDQYAQAKVAAQPPGARPMTAQERQAYGLPAEGGAAMTPDGPKTLGAPTTNFTANIDNKGPDEYDKTISGSLAKSHGSLMSDVEGAQGRARDIAAMQQSIDAIQKRGGTTGGMAQPQILELAKTLNAGAAALGQDAPFDEKNISDKELLAKFNRDMAGAQAKGAVGSRVTNFEMSNYLKANPGLETSITGNQRLLGIKAQIEQRNAAVGNAMRAEAANSIGQGKKVDPARMEKIIRDYDEANHVKDPITGQDLTQSYTLPEFQNAPGSSNKALSTDNKANMKKLGAKTYEKIDGVWHEVQ